MILRSLAILLVIASILSPATAQTRVTVGLTRTASNGGVFLAASRGYFKAEGLDVELRGFSSPQAVVQALAAGALDFGVAAFTPAAFNLAGRGAIKAIAAQARERRDYEGNVVVASGPAYDRGLHSYADLAGRTIAISVLGSAFHYQLGQIARSKGFALDSVTLRPLQTLDAMARAVEDDKVDAAILPARYAHDVLTTSQAKFIGWCSDLDEHQFGALFTRAAMIATRRATVEKFVRAYRRGVADYAVALFRHDRFGKRVSDAKSRAVAAVIAAYVYPDRSDGAVAAEASVYFIDPRARIDTADIARQFAWYKAQGLIDANADARAAVDLSFTAGP